MGSTELTRGFTRSYGFGETFTKVCPRCCGARDTNSGFTELIPTEEMQWRRLCAGAEADKTSLFNPRSRGESESDSSESTENRLTQKGALAAAAGFGRGAEGGTG